MGEAETDTQSLQKLAALAQQDPNSVNLVVLELGNSRSVVSQQQGLQSLINYSSLIKKEMSRNWKNKFLPNLHFVLDESFDYAEKIEKLIIKTHEND